MIGSALKRLFTSPVITQSANEAYLEIMAASRRPVFYKDWQVPDTLDGRFDILTLHLSLVLARCEKEKAAQGFIRVLSEIFFADMDRNLREMGVGDTGIAKRMKNMAQAFYGRLAAYENDGALEAALAKNVWREHPVDKASLAALAEYMRESRAALERQPIEEILTGRLIFS